MHVDRSYISAYAPVFGIPEVREQGQRVAQARDSLNRERRKQAARQDSATASDDAVVTDAGVEANKSETQPLTKHALDITV